MNGFARSKTNGRLLLIIFFTFAFLSLGLDGSKVQGRLCQSDNYGGACELFTGKDANLADNSVGDNSVSSVKVESRGDSSCKPSADQVALFANTNYTGRCVTLNIGRYPDPGHLGQLGNDNAASIKVGSNVRAIVFRLRDYNGNSEIFTANDSDLGNNAIGKNTISSVKVQSRTQPDLQPFTLAGYPYPVTPSSIPDTHEVNTLYAGQRTYFDWHFINSSTAIASGSFHVELWVDDIRYIHYPYSDYVAGRTGGFDDWAETINTPGWHTVKLITDPDNTIAEANETNNVWESQFFWESSGIVPPNNDFNNAVVITAVPYNNTQDTTGATTAVDDPIFSCLSAQGYNSVWYNYTPSANGNLSINTFGSNYDTVLAVWTGTQGNLTNSACNNDTSGLQSQVSAAVSAGTTYFIEIADVNPTSSGSLILSVEFTSTPVIDSVSPNRLSGDSDTVITIHGSGFIDNPIVSLDDRVIQSTYAASDTLTVVVPKKTKPGIYKVIVRDLAGGIGTLPEGLTIYETMVEIYLPVVLKN